MIPPTTPAPQTWHTVVPDIASPRHASGGLSTSHPAGVGAAYTRRTS